MHSSSALGERQRCASGEGETGRGRGTIEARLRQYSAGPEVEGRGGSIADRG